MYPIKETFMIKGFSVTSIYLDMCIDNLNKSILLSKYIIVNNTDIQDRKKYEWLTHCWSLNGDDYSWARFYHFLYIYQYVSVIMKCKESHSKTYVTTTISFFWTPVICHIWMGKTMYVCCLLEAQWLNLHCVFLVWYLCSDQKLNGYLHFVLGTHYVSPLVLYFLVSQATVRHLCVDD